MHATRTTTVAWMICFCVGHSTFFSSPQDSGDELRAWEAMLGSGCGCSSARAVGRGGGAWRPARKRGFARASRGRAQPGGRVVVLSSDGPSASLAVGRMAPAPAAVLLELHAVGRVPLRLARLVVASLALRACERDCDSDSGCHLCSLGRRNGPREMLPRRGTESVADYCSRTSAARARLPAFGSTTQHRVEPEGSVVLGTKRRRPRRAEPGSVRRDRPRRSRGLCASSARTSASSRPEG